MDIIPILTILIHGDLQLYVEMKTALWMLTITLLAGCGTTTAKELTNDIFTKKDLTVVNLWGTFCGPCIEEMSELAQLSEKYADTVQFIGIVGDVDGPNDTKHLELAKTITDKSEVTYPNLIVSDDFKDLLSGIIGYPTTIFVDNAGNIIGDPIVGSDVPLTEKRIQNQGQNVEQ